MIKVKKIELENGLTLVLIKDNKKNAKGAHLSVNVGGFVKDFNMDGKDYYLKYGIAHFLEHYLLEKSIYGNVMQQFGSDYIDANGVTGPYRTLFFINTVHDFEDNLVKLLNVVNNPAFKEESIEDIKTPILREIDKSLDRPYRNVYKYSFNNIFKEIPFDPVLGEKESIKNMTIEDIRLFHRAFYNAKNELLVISGNIDENKIIELVNKTYNNFLNNDHKVERYDYKETDEVVKRECKTQDNKSFLKVSYKINVSKFTPEEKDKLSYYITYTLMNNFSPRSELYKYIIDNKISSFAISAGADFAIDKRYALVNLIINTERFDEAKELLLDKMNNLEYDEETFKVWKNGEIISMINKQEHFGSIVNDYLENVKLYDHYSYDDLDFVNKLSLKECKTMIGKFDLSNYNITICEKK